MVCCARGGRMKNLDALTEKAFLPEGHPITEIQIRELLYAEKSGEPVNTEVQAHFQNCNRCAQIAGIILRTDPQFNKNAPRRVNVTAPC